MTNYLASMAAVLFIAGAAQSADAPAVTTPVARPAAGGLPHWVQAATGSSLTFTFDQAGAASKGSFRQFTTELAYDEQTPAAGSLDVKVQIASLDTQDQERNEMLAGADLFDAKRFPTASYLASSFARSATGELTAVGKLTLRGVTRDLRLPLKVVRTATGLELSGETAIRRLDYGVGQGDWRATDGVGDAVKIHYKVALVKAK